MEAHVELSRKRGKDLADINNLLINLSQWQTELRLATLRDRLADVEKLKTRYQRQVDVLSTESCRSGWKNREFKGHAEMVTLDQFDEQKGVEKDHYSVRYYMQQLGDEINIVYPADVLKMLDEEKDGPSTSASVAKEIVLAPAPPEQATEVFGDQPGEGALTGGGSSAIILYSDDFDPGMPSSAAASPSVEAGVASLPEGN
ncbi:hypothetical protein PanWU01x14_228590 [Parasponia andersonii]|uniref:Uncharacterized protein n=1 Tax=Parasponia andersonii TaxID=3476 RepID=A0A2P5BLL4_PARAD|nr:hypothetical protein PanWU01x14_228590 [Parasponia andersonii]